MNRLTLPALTLAAAAAALAATATAPGCTSNAAAPTAELHVLTWSDYFAKDTISNFEKEHGCRVVLDYMESSETLKTKLARPPSGYDVVFPSDEVVTDLSSKDLLERLDGSKIPNLKNLAPRFRGLSYDPKNEWSVAFMWGTTGLAFDRSKVTPAADSWGALWDERYDGKVTMLDDMRECFAAAMRFEGLDPAAAPTAEGVEKAKKRLLSRKPLAYDSSARTMLVSGDAWVSQIFSGDAVQTAAERSEVTYVIPKEGATLWIDNMSIAKGAANATLAYAFIDYILRPDVSAAITNERRFANPNEAARSGIKKEILEDPRVYPSEEVLKRCHVLREPSPEVKKLMQDAWARVRGR
jgi:spermidine/putrescine-binding protein